MTTSEAVSGEVVAHTTGDVEPSQSELDAVTEAIRSSLAANTRASYASAWGRFVRWCDRRGLSALPADPLTVCVYLTEAADATRPGGKYVYRASTIDLWLTAINQVHSRAGHPRPRDVDAVAKTIAGIRRTRGEPPRRAAPLLTDDIQRIVDGLDYTLWPDGLSATRDAAILLVGFAGAFRRSELADLRRCDIHPVFEGLRITLPRSKTDQAGEGLHKAIPFGQQPLTCPCCALWRWIALVDLVDEGADRAQLMAAVMALDPDTHLCRDPHPDLDDDRRPVFRQIPRHGHITAWTDAPDPVHTDSLGRTLDPAAATRMTGQGIHRMLRRRAKQAGINPARISGHSLRVGMVTEALRRGADTLAVRRQTGHQSDTMLDVYDREQNPFRRNAVNELGL